MLYVTTAGNAQGTDVITLNVNYAENLMLNLYHDFDAAVLHVTIINLFSINAYAKEILVGLVCALR